ncbi:MAG: hypothetical protein ACXWC9_04695 [Pseudobdellovibrionaceae bacterium]
MQKKFATFCLMISLLTLSTSSVRAAGETGHSDLVELIAMFYGLNPNAAALMSSLNQGMDTVLGAKAIMSGVSSDKNHFSRIVTPIDLDSSKLNSQGKQSQTAALASMLVADMLGGSVAVVGDPESHELANKALREKDPTNRIIKWGAGMHSSLDLAGFHNGFKGGMPLPIPFLGRFFQIPLGHLVEGQTTDRITLKKFINALYALGPQFILMRETQRNGFGVNQQWLDMLKSQGVNVNDVNSMIHWFTNQPDIKAELIQIEAMKNPTYLKMVMEEMEIRLWETRSFKSREVLYERINSMQPSIQEGVPAEYIVFDMIEKAWSAGELNEKSLLRNVFANARSNARTLQELVNPIDASGLPEEIRAIMKNDPSQNMYTREWVVWFIVEKMGKNLVKTPYSQMDVRYLSKAHNEKLSVLERESITRIQKAIFGEDSIKYKFVNNPGVTWMKIAFKNLLDERRKVAGKPMLEKIVAYSDAILKSVVETEMHLKSFSAKIGFKYWLMNFKYTHHEAFVEPLTTKGNLNYMYEEDRNEMIKSLRKKFGKGFLVESVLAEYDRYLSKINDKYNTPDKPIGAIQKSAAAVKSGAQYLQRVTGAKATIRTCRSTHR